MINILWYFMIYSIIGWMIEVSYHAVTMGKVGADFKRQFTFASYQAFFAEAGYTDVDCTMIEGKVPCALAVIHKA